MKLPGNFTTRFRERSKPMKRKNPSTESVLNTSDVRDNAHDVRPRKADASSHESVQHDEMYVLGNPWCWPHYVLHIRLIGSLFYLTDIACHFPPPLCRLCGRSSE
jgi:hypothetical protein